VIPLSRHFLNELRQRVYRASTSKWGPKFRLGQAEIEDLKLWEHLLTVSHKGISLNLMIERHPTHLAWSDSCPFGMGGYTLGGRAWRLRIPDAFPFFGEDSANNLLEFLAMYVSVELLRREAADTKFPCFLALGDNTSAISWIFKSGSLAKGSAYYTAVKKVARRMAKNSIEGHYRLAAQHIKGKKNDVADFLSYHGSVRGKESVNPLTGDSPDDETLTKRFHSHLPHLIPQNFKISPLPEEVTSFVFAILQTYAASHSPNERAATKTETEPGVGGRDTLRCWDQLTYSSMIFPSKPKPASQKVSLPSSGLASSTSRADLLASVRNQWLLRLCRTPLAMWHRRCGVTTGTVLSTSKEEPSVRLNESDGMPTSC